MVTKADLTIINADLTIIKADLTIIKAVFTIIKAVLTTPTNTISCSQLAVFTDNAGQKIH